MAQPKLFGTELRRLRVAAELSLGDLADLVHYSKGYLSKIESGGKPPNVALARRCDAALSAGGSLAALVRNDQKTSKPIDDRTADDGETWLLSLAANGEYRLASAEGLGVPLLRSNSSFWFDMPVRGMATAAEDDGTVATFRLLLGEYLKIISAIGAGAALPGLMAHALMLRSLAGRTTSGNRTQFLHLASVYASFAGEAAYEVGNDRAAEWWANLGVSIADAIETAGVSAYSRILSAELALGRENSADAIAISQQAQHDSTATARLRGMVVVREARAYAQIGDYEQCERALDRAGTWFDGDEPIVLDGLIVNQIDGMHIYRVWTAWCLFDLGQASRAASLLDEEVGRIPELLHHHAASFGVRRALAHAAAGEVDYACNLTATLLDAFPSLDLAPTRRDLHALARTLGRWRTHRPAREVNAQLIEILRQPAW